MYADVLGTVKEGVQTSDATDWTLEYPELIQPGELLGMFGACDGVLGSNPTMPSGWITSRAATPASAAQQLFAKKKATGQESGTFTMTLSAAEQGCWKVARLGPWAGNLGANFTNSDPAGGSFPFDAQHSGTGTTVGYVGASNPFNWQLDDTLWVVHQVADGGDTVFSAPPTDFTLIGTIQASGGADGAAQMVAYRKLRVESLDPADTTISPSEEWAASIFPLQPLGAGGPRRLFGPSPVPSSPTTIYLVPENARAMVRNVHAYNPGPGTVNLTVSIGADGAGTRIYDNYPVPEDTLLPRRWFQYVLSQTEVIQASASIANQLVLTIDGEQVPTELE